MISEEIFTIQIDLGSWYAKICKETVKFIGLINTEIVVTIVNLRMVILINLWSELPADIVNLSSFKFGEKSYLNDYPKYNM